MGEVTIGAGFPEGDRARIADLLRAYEAGLGIPLSFQSFDAEIAGLPGVYVPPGGQFYVARLDGVIHGLVAFRALDAKAGIAEMKRLFVGAELRGRGIGRRLAERVIKDATDSGYRHLRLDTLPAMIEAQSLYTALGFMEIAAYNDNPVAGTRFMEKILK